MLSKVKGWLKNKNNNKFLLILIFIDLIATMLWYTFFGIEEANPVLASPIETSLLRFTIIKLSLSLPAVWLLNKYKQNIFSQLGSALLLFVYTVLCGIHCWIFLNIVTAVL